MASPKQREPKIHVDDLHPVTDGFIRGYKATWQEGTLTASASLEPIDDQPARGYMLTCTYQHNQPNRQLSEKQMDAGTTLVSKVRELMVGQMIRAGWQEIGRDVTHPIWQHSSRLSTKATSERAQAAQAPVREGRQAKARQQLDQVIAAQKAEQEQDQLEITIDDPSIPPYTMEMKARHESPREYHAVASLGDVQASLTIRHNTLKNHLYPGGYALFHEMIDRVDHYAPGAMGRKQEARARALQPILRERVEAALQAAGWEQHWKTSPGVELWLYVGQPESLGTSSGEKPEREGGHRHFGRNLSMVTVARLFPQGEQAGARAKKRQALPFAAPAIRTGQDEEKLEFPDSVLSETETEAPGQREHQDPQSHVVEVIGGDEAKARGKLPAYSRVVFTREVTFTCIVCRQTVTQQRYPGHTPLYCSDECKEERQLVIWVRLRPILGSHVRNQHATEELAVQSLGNPLPIRASSIALL